MKANSPSEATTISGDSTQNTNCEIKQLMDDVINDHSIITIIDVRDASAFKERRLDLPSGVSIINVPYVELLEETGLDDLSDAAEAYAKAHLSHLTGRRVAVVCAKGRTSAFVAEGLRRVGIEACSLIGGMQAWGDYYDVRAVVETPRLTILQVSRPARGCLSYVIASEGKAIVVDPLRHVDRYKEILAAHQLEMGAVIDTHGHADHISSGPRLAADSGASYWLHAYDAIHPIDVLPATFEYEPLWDGQEFEIGNINVKALHVPGHTLGNMALLVDNQYLIAGDTLFVESVARPDLGGKADTWAPLHFRSLSRLLELSDNVTVLPGHYSGPGEVNPDGVVSTTISKVKIDNEDVALLLRGGEQFISHILSALPSFPPQYVDIKRVNAGLLQVDEEKASELELGRNECALSRKN